VAGQVISVEPAADFGNGHGVLVVSDAGCPDRVVIEQADRVIYVRDEWLDRAAYGEFGWAEVAWLNPWHLMLRIRGISRLVVYDQRGTCGPRVMAHLLEQPD
jgi:hypothetical protein